MLVFINFSIVGFSRKYWEGISFSNMHRPFPKCEGIIFCTIISCLHYIEWIRGYLLGEGAASHFATAKKRA